MKLKSTLFPFLSHSQLNKFYLAIIALLLGPFVMDSNALAVDPQSDLQKIYSSFRLEYVWRIDTGNKEFMEKGLYDISRFTVDAKGNIYLLNPKNEGDQIFVVDKTGKLIRSFGQRGQGPGELERPIEIFLTTEGNIFVQDGGRAKVAIFSPEGVCLRELKFPSGIWSLYPLPDGRYIGLESIFGAEVKQWGVALNCYDPEFKKIRELDSLSFPNPVTQKTIEATPHMIVFQVAGERIYSAFPERGYEFLVFNLKAEPVRKISVEAKTKASLEDYKKVVDKDIGGLTSFGVKPVYPKEALPFYSFFTDENGYLFVMTFQPGKQPDEFIYDIISPEGKLLGNVSLGPYFSNSAILAKIIKGHLYWVREKKSGEKEFIVSKIY